MSISTDRALYKSDFERNENDRYFTEPAATQALLQHFYSFPSSLDVKTVWEPAVGRGDMANELSDFGLNVLETDIDVSERDCADQADFLTETPFAFNGNPFEAIISNPPYVDNAAELFVRRSLEYKEARIVAMFLRSEFDKASTRNDLFTKQPFAAEIVLTWRPRWDWWLTDEEKAAAKVAAGKAGDAPDSSPRHNFSWFVWDRAWTGPGVKFYSKKPKAQKITIEDLL